MLAVAVTGAPTAAPPGNSSACRPPTPADLATFASRLRKHAVLERVTAAISARPPA